MNEAKEFKIMGPIIDPNKEMASLEHLTGSPLKDIPEITNEELNHILDLLEVSQKNEIISKIRQAVLNYRCNNVELSYGCLTRSNRLK